MNNDPSTSARATDLPTSIAAETTFNSADAVEPPQDDAKTLGQKSLQAVTHRKNELLAHLLSNLDSIIYTELAVLYYMEYVYNLMAVHQIH